MALFSGPEMPATGAPSVLFPGERRRAVRPDDDSSFFRDSSPRCVEVEDGDARMALSMSLASQKDARAASGNVRRIALTLAVATLYWCTHRR